MNDYLSIIRGKTVLITRDFQANIFLHYSELTDREIQNDWLIALKMDFMIRLNLINKNHPNQKQIAKIIGNSLHEYGIKVKIDRLAKHGWLLYYYLLERFSSTEMIDIKQLMHAKHNQTFDEFVGVFILFLFLLLISTIVFVIEIAYSMYVKLNVVIKNFYFVLSI